MISMKQTYRLNFPNFKCPSLRFRSRKVCNLFSGRAQVLFWSLTTERNMVVKENAMPLAKDKFEYSFKKLNTLRVDETRTPIFIHPFSSSVYVFSFSSFKSNCWTKFKYIQKERAETYYLNMLGFGTFIILI